MSCSDIVCGTRTGNFPKPGDPDNTSTLSAVGVPGGINVSWTYPVTNPHAVAYVDIFRAESAQFDKALKRARVSGDFYFDRIGSADIKQYFYWIQITSVNGTVGELIGPASATPADGLQDVLDKISGILDESYLDSVLRAKIDKIQQIEFDLGAEVSKRLVQNATMGEALSAVQSETGQALAYIQSEITQRTDSDEALLNSVNSLAVGMADNAAALVEEQTVRATADSALASDITALYSNVAANTSAISSEATTRANAVSSMATTINSVTAVANAKNKTFSQAAAPTIGMDAGDLWFDTDDGNKPYRYSGTAWVATDDARIAANMASISNEATARANADTAIASSVTNLVSAVASKIKTYRQTTEPTVGMSLGDVWFDSDDGNKMYRYDGASWIATDDSRIASNVAAIANEAATRATADTALATSISTIQTQLSSDGVTGSAIIQAQTTANTAVTDARTAQTTANNASTAAGTAQTTANTAVTNAATAQTTANTAVSDASSALSKLTDIASDSLLTPDEKPSIIAQRDAILAEQAGIDTTATTFGITTEKTAYDNAVSALTTYLATLTAPVLWSMLTGNTTIVGTTFRTKFNDVYTTRQALLNAISAKAKTLADTAQTQANTAVANAAAAQTTANTAVTNAATAQTAANTANATLADIASDSMLTPVEKSSVRAEWDVIAAEKAGLNSQATTFSTTTENTTYNTSFQALATYLNNGTAWASGIPSWIANANLSVTTTIVGATFRTKFSDYYTARTALLNAISVKAKTLADTAQVQANTATTNAATAQGTADTKIKTFFQTTAPVASTVGDLWVDIDDNNHIYRWSGIAWIDAHDARITSTASTVSTLQTTVGDHTAAIQTAASSIDGLTAQYTVKVDNNGYISGFGLASTPKDDIPYSEFAVLANSFKIGAPDGTKTPFAVVDIGEGVYKTLLNSDVIIGGNVDIANLKSGSLPSDVKMRLGDGIIDLDGAGEIRVYKDRTPNSDYVRLSSGEIRFLKYIDGSYQTYNYLSRLESGEANNNTVVTIPGYWKSQPRVMVSPASLQMYNAAYAAQNQAINCKATSVVETAAGSMKWQFTPVATLTLASGTVAGAINDALTTPDNVWYSSNYTTNANTASINLSVDVQSNRGTGVVNQYAYRQVTVYVQYWNGTSWIDGAYKTVPIGAALGYVNATVSLTFPSSGTWTYRVKYAAADAGGNFSTGAQTYDYATDLHVNGIDPASIALSIFPGTGTVYTKSQAVSVPGYSVPGGWTITSVRYLYDVAYYQYVAHQSTGWARSTVGGKNFSKVLQSVTANTPYQAGNSSLTNWQTIDYTVNTNSFDPVICTATSQVSNYSTGRSDTSMDIRKVSVWVTRSKPQTGSTTPSNTGRLSSYVYNLSTAQVLATGSLNWLAVGE